MVRTRGAKAKCAVKISRSTRAGLNFPVGRILCKLKQGRYAKRIGTGAAVFLAAVLEYVTSEMLELGGNNAIDKYKKKITPRHLLISVTMDQELNKIMGKVTMPGAGIVPTIYPFPVPGNPFKYF